MKDNKTKRVVPHFELSKDKWDRLKEAMRLRGRSASFFLREKVDEFLEGEGSTEPPLARYRRTFCVNCRGSDECQSDRTLENSCIAASLYFSFSRRFGYDARAHKRGLAVEEDY